MRKRILIERSIGLDEELSSVAIIKNGTKAPWTFSLGGSGVILVTG
jgi:hypothetical protein